jgi:UDP-N-acetylmuramoyl-L-alanyl-D-glutamate--2,6-diaminopimelate ligase
MLSHSPLKPGVARCAVLNADDNGSFAALRQALAEEAAQFAIPVTVRSYGLADPASAHPSAPDVMAANIVYAPDRTRFDLRWWGGEFAVESQLIGEFNVANVLASATVALALGVAPPVIQEGIARFVGVLGRMERIDRGQPFLALVDFAHTPVSLERALLTLRPLVGQRDTGEAGRLIAVFGSAGLRDRAKRYLMGQVSGRLADFTVITAEDPRTEAVNDINAEIARGVREGASAAQYTIVPDRTEAIQVAVDMAQSGDVVATFGKGHERSMCYGEIEYPWSDQDALVQALERRVRRQ